MSESFRGKTVVITGAANGIGRALAHAFAARGASLELCDIDEPGLAAVAAELPDDLWNDAARATGVWRLDVRDEARAVEVMAAIVARRGGIDVLVNNAGISHHSLADETSRGVVTRVMDVNFYGAVNCTLAALPSLKARRGVIVTMSSVAGFAPLFGRSAYAASKHALHGWFDTLRGELAKDQVAVMLVCPSFVRTGIDQRALGGDGGPAPQGKPVVGRPADPETVARTVVQAVAHRRRHVAPTALAQVAWWMNRLVPDLYERLMLRSQARHYPGNDR